jgi:hypothetical protein
MPDKNGKRGTQRTETGYEIPVPKRSEDADVFEAPIISGCLVP